MAQSAGIKKMLNPWHRKLADWLLENGTGPGWNKKASEAFGVSPAWISTVVHSDAFQDHYQRLRAELDSLSVFSTHERLRGTLDQTIDIVQERLETQRETIPLGQLLDAVDILGKRTGLGEKTQVDNHSVQNNILVVSAEALEESRKRMRGASPLRVIENLSNSSNAPTPEESS
jgi:hypothetical protein